MYINSKVVTDPDELRQIIHDGANPMQCISSEFDIDLLADTLVDFSFVSSKVPYRTSNWVCLLLKSLIYYVLATQETDEDKSFAHCRELLQNAKEKGVDNDFTDMIFSLPFDHPGRILYEPLRVLPDDVYKEVVDILDATLEL